MLQLKQCQTAEEVWRLARDVRERMRDRDRRYAPRPPAPPKLKIVPPPLPPVPRTVPSIGEIQRAVADEFEISLEAMLVRDKRPTAALARMLAMALASHLTNRSSLVIAREFDGRDHTTVVNANRKFARLIRDLSAAMPATATVKQWVAASSLHMKVHPPTSYVVERQTHCWRGHPFEGGNVVIEGNKRRCLTCRQILREKGKGQ